MISSRELSKINYDLAVTFNVKVSLISELRRKLKNLLFQMNQSSPLELDKSKTLIIAVLSQPETFVKEHKF